MWRPIRELWLTMQLRIGSVESRRRAATQLAHQPGNLGVNRLCKAVGDPDEGVRLAALTSLGNSGDRRAISCLLEVLSDAAERKAWTEWCAAVEALGALAATEAVEPLIELCFGGNVRLPWDAYDTVVRAAGQIGQGRGALLILPRLDPRCSLWEEARECLLQIGAPAIEPLRLEFLKRRWPSIAPMLELLGWYPQTQEERILWGLSRREFALLSAEGPAAVEPMIRWYFERHVDPPERLEMLSVFAELPSDVVAPVLVNLAKGVHSKITWGRNHDESKFEELRRLVDLLGKKCAVQGVPCLVGLLDLRNWMKWELRELAVDALIQIGEASSGPVQEALLAQQIEPRHGLAVLQQVGVERVEPGLISFLNDSDPHLRRLASEALERSGWSPTTHEETVSRHVARGEWVQAVSLGADVRTPLLQALGSATPGQHGPALFEVAARTRDVEVVQGLITCVMSKNVDGRVDAASGALIEMGEFALPALLEKLDERDSRQAEVAAAIVAKIGSPAIPELLKRLADPRRRGAAAHALHLMGWRAEDPNQAELMAIAQTEQAVASAIARGELEEAGALGPLSVPALLELWPTFNANDYGGGVNWYADSPRCESIVRALGRAGGETAISHLQDILGNRHAPLWGTAALVLADLKAPSALPILLGVVRQQSCGKEFLSATTALGRYGAPVAIEPLLEVIDSNENYRNYQNDVCRVARQSILTLGEPALAELLAISRNKDSKLRVAAVKALEVFSLDAVGPALRELLQDNADVREAAANALEWLLWHPADDTDRVWREIARANFAAAAKLGVPAIGPLVQLIESADKFATQASQALCSLQDRTFFSHHRDLLRHASSSVRETAVEALAHCQHPDVVPTLLAELERGTDSESVERVLLKSLGTLGDMRAVDPLISRLDSKAFKWDAEKALVALAKHGPEVAERLAEGLAPTRSSDERIRRISLLASLPDEQVMGFLESIVEDPSPEVAEAALSELDKMPWEFERPVYRVLARVRKIERRRWESETELTQALQAGLADTPTSLLRRVLTLKEFMDYGVETNYFNPNNHDEGWREETYVRTRTTYSEAKHLARKELQRREEVE